MQTQQAVRRVGQRSVAPIALLLVLTSGCGDNARATPTANRSESAGDSTAAASPSAPGDTSTSTPPTTLAVDPAAVALCQSKARPDDTLIAVYPTTVYHARLWFYRGDRNGGSTPWPEWSDDQAVTICWYDGHVAKSPPPGVDGVTQPDFDRFVLVIDASGHSNLAVAAYRDRFQPQAP